MVLSKGSIWDIAETETRKIYEVGEGNENPSLQATVLFVGTRGAGKTTMIQRFLDREDSSKSTLALEYTYARKSGKTLAKNVCHIWELGGGAVFTSLLTTPITHRSITSLAICLLLDLSKPETIWSHLEMLLKEIKERIKEVIRSREGREQNLEEKLMESTSDRIGKEHQDRNIITPCLVPIVIFGGKFDIFENMDPENKKLICRALRFLAHINGASLVFFSSKDSGLVKKAKDTISHYGFGTTESKSISQDYNKPLIIPAGSDSLSFISGSVEGGAHSMSYDAWKRAFFTKFPQEDKTAASLPADPSRDPSYAELDVDNLRAQKDQELEKLRREIGIEVRPKSSRSLVMTLHPEVPSAEQ